MGIAEIVFLCFIVAAIFFLIGYGVSYLVYDRKCRHDYEEVLSPTINKGKYIAIHMCKKCGKRKITRV